MSASERTWRMSRRIGWRSGWWSRGYPRIRPWGPSKNQAPLECGVASVQQWSWLPLHLADFRAIASRIVLLNQAGSLQGAWKQATRRRLLHGAKADREGRWTPLHQSSSTGLGLGAYQRWWRRSGWVGKRKAPRWGMQRRGEGSLVDHVNDSIRKYLRR